MKLCWEGCCTCRIDIVDIINLNIWLAEKRDFVMKGVMQKLEIEHLDGKQFLLTFSACSAANAMLGRQYVVAYFEMRVANASS